MIQDGAEIMVDGAMAQRGVRMLRALIDAAPAGSAVTKSYAGRHNLLVLYGVGLQYRFDAMQAHRARGGHVAMWDLGYFDRDEAMRVSIDALHPTAEQLMLSPPGNSRRAFALRQDADPGGPVLLVGLGNKSAHMYRLAPMEWEHKAMKRIAARYPGRKVLWRPKGRRMYVLPNTALCHGQPIEEALRGCSIVVCRHSNVAVDACIAGVPVDCQDGAALALYGDNPAPTLLQRAEFLQRLTWWNWRPSEAPEAWAWMRKVIA